jgi:DUF4097 and DUF4098 domain-containing protein YvlB
VHKNAGISSLCIIAAAITGCHLAPNEYQRSEHTDQLKYYWPSDSLSQIVVSSENGNITITAATGDSASAVVDRTSSGTDNADAKAHIDSVIVSTILAAGVLTLKADMPDNNPRTFSAGFVISVPAAVAATLNTANGDISISGISGSASQSAANGNITIAGHTGEVTAECDNGIIECEISALGAADSVMLKAANGNITLHLPRLVLARFDARAGIGNVLVSGFSTILLNTDLPAHKAGTIGAGTGESYVGLSTDYGDIIIDAR